MKKQKEPISPLSHVCANCMDFDAAKNVCTIRNLVRPDKTQEPLPRKPTQRGCEVFMMK